jgi:glycosyltransferase involved in cell wall biosynthesis
VWCGSLSTVYRFDLAIRFADVLEMPLLVLTREADLARAQLGERASIVRTVAPEDVAGELHPGDVGISFIVGSYDGHMAFANLARAPTRLAEYLAAGMVVAVSPGVGDVDAVVSEHQLGAIVADESDGELARAAQEVRALAAQPQTWERARSVARERFHVDAGAARYLDLYRQLVASERTARPS